jgi:Matrixin
MIPRLHTYVLAVFGLMAGTCGPTTQAVTSERDRAAHTPPACIDSRTLPKHDRWHGFALLTIRHATRETPEVVEFETDGITDVVLERAVHQYLGRVRLDIEEVPTASGAVSAGCSTGWFELSGVRQVRVPAEGEGRHHWRVSVFEDTAGRPSDDDPYLIGLHVTSTTTLDRQGGCHRDTEYSGIATEPQIACERAAASVRPSTELEVAMDITRTQVPRGSDWLLYANAGKRAYLQVSASQPTRVRVRLFAKEPGGRAYTGICVAEAVPAGPLPSGYILGALPWERHLVAFWRIEITPEEGSANAELTATVFREHNPLAQVQTSSDEKTKSAIGLLTECYECRTSKPPAVRRQQNQAQTPPYTRLLPVALRLTTQGDFNADARATLLRSLRAALGVWVVNCRRCNYDTLAVARVDQEVWVRADFGDPITKRMASGLRTLTKTPAGQLLLTQQIGYAPTAVAGRELYVSVGPNRLASLPICQERAVQSPEISRIQQALGCTTAGARLNEVILTLALRPDGKTACGASSNDIACEADKELLEFNTRDYAFCLPGATESCIGNGPRHINLMHVLLHEAGHWLGLGHIEKPDAIMASSLALSRCLSDEDADDLLGSLTSPPQLPVMPASFRLQATGPGGAH